MSQHFFSEAQPADILEGLLDPSSDLTLETPPERLETPLAASSRTQQEQAHRIFDLVRGFDVQDVGTAAHERFLEDLYWEVNMFMVLRAATLEVRNRIDTESQTAVEQEEARQVHEAYLNDVLPAVVAFRPPRPLTMLPLRKPGTDSFVFSQTCGSGQLLFPSAVERSHLESVNDQCIICTRDYKDFTFIHELTNGNLVSVLHACKHVFHFDCLLPWFAQKNTCPLCRTPCF
jgi:hypothetical protein